MTANDLPVRNPDGTLNREWVKAWLDEHEDILRAFAPYDNQEWNVLERRLLHHFGGDWEQVRAWLDATHPSINDTPRRRVELFDYATVHQLLDGEGTHAD